ncbi:hypothetical protein BH23CHL2_BH23CHL2_29640 [soil metagenome]
MPFAERNAWIILLLIQLLILLVVLSGEEGPVGEGSVSWAFFTHEATDEVNDLRMRGSLVLGMAVFGLALILKPFRQEQRWAWYALWYYPLFFLIHILAFDTLLPDGIFVILTIGALLVPYRRFFPRGAFRHNSWREPDHAARSDAATH